MVAGVLLAAINLRAAIIAVSPLMDEIRADTGFSSAIGSLLTTLPVLCFGLASLVAPRLARKIGLDLTLILALVTVAAGIAIRLLPGMVVLFAGTAILGLAIGVSNVLLPASIKRDFPDRTGIMTGLLTTGLSLSGTLGAGLTIPLQDSTGLDWRGTLALWAIPLVFAVLLMLPRLVIFREHAARFRPRVRVSVSLWRDRVAWSVTGIMGLQSFGFYALATWLPSIMTDNGMSEERAGFMLSLTNFAGFISSFIIPLIAVRLRNQKPIIWGTVGVWLTALVGLAIAPVDFAVLWMILWGLAGGSGLAISLLFFAMRSPDANHAAALSGMAQSVGYAFASTGPFLVGLLHDVSGNWTSALLFLMVAQVAMLVVGLRAAQNRLVGSS